MNRGELERLAARWRRHHAFRSIGLGTAAGLVAASLVARNSTVLGAAIGGLVAAGLAAWCHRRTPVVTAEVVAAHLNRLRPSLEESATLWLRAAGELSTLERMQLNRLNAAWEKLPERATLGQPRWGALGSALAGCIGAAMVLLAVVFWPASVPLIVAPEPAPAVVGTERPRNAGPVLRAAVLAIEPPAYLGLPARRVTGLDAEVAEGSNVTWELEFAGDVAGVTMVSPSRDHDLELPALGGGRFRGHAMITGTRLYQVSLAAADGAKAVWPELHALKAIRDQPPRLTWQEPVASRTIVDPSQGRPTVTVRLGAVDDYGVAGVHLVMTVAKGSGEGVKFREQQVDLERIGAVSPAGEVFGRELDLFALGLEPGDELYFFALARDRRTPVPNQTRSETRFVVLRGPETPLADLGLAVAGVNRVPQFFRSQRQLILDTQRLLAEQPTLAEEKFRGRAEEIGVDQKLLRLRYGQFLGEEFAAAGDGAPREAQAMALVGARRSQSREESLRAAAIERVVEAQHAHAPPAYTEGRPPTVEELMASSLHQHDSPEAATLFDSQVKASLRSVLGAMWEAEGFLRTGQPAQALPAENRALELLKALQQADRVYVRRIGYEPAPLKEAERRLRGELASIPARAQDRVPTPEPDPDAPALRAALAAIGREREMPLPAEAAGRVEARLVGAALENPDTTLPALELWRRRAAGLGMAERDTLRRALWSLLPKSDESPRRPAEAAPTLARRYDEALDGRAGGGR